jgi:hypothetical protein
MNKEEIAHKIGYRIDDLGRIINPRGIVLKGHIRKQTGYLSLGFRYLGETYKLNAHRLQAFQKYNSRIFEKGICVRHLNGNKIDASKDNIAIGTQSENMMDISPEIRLSRSIRAASFIKKHDRTMIQEFHDIHKSYKKTMDYFRISSKGTLNYILRT